MSRAKSRPPRNKGKQHSWLRRLRWKIIRWGVLIGTLAFVVYFLWAWSLDLGKVNDMVERSIIYDMDGQIYSRLEGENRSPVTLAKVSPHFIKALIAREDTRFYEHKGVDPIGIMRAMARNLVRLRASQGASTLTQQLARNTFPLGGRNLHRKILEAFVAVRLERNFTKDQILTHYINRIYFGSGFYGLQAASLAYFNKSAADLNLSESAMLAGLIRSPTRFSPWLNLRGAYAERDTVLERMRDLGMVTPEQARAAMEAEVHLSNRNAVLLQQNYALDMVRDEVQLLLGDAVIAEGGLRIYTTIDPELQKQAELAVDKQLQSVEQKSGYNHPRRSGFTGSDGSPTPYLQGALTVVDNRTGGLRAIVGGRNYSESTFNRALLAKRQIGSTFKPFVYSAAFAAGLSSTSSISDGPIEGGEIRGAPNWQPANSDDSYRGNMSVADGLIFSRNTVSVRVGNHAGIMAVARTAKAAGLGTIPRFPAVYLGAFESTVKELTAAYSIFPNLGVRRQPYIIERIQNTEGRVLFRAAHVQTQALSSHSCSQINSVLKRALEQGTGAGARSLGFQKSAAGKTGTTNGYRDAWFVGYTKSLTCGVWVGLDKPESIMPRGYGAALALPIWVDVMNAASAKKYPSSDIDAAQADPKQPSGFMRSIRRLFGGQ